MISAEVLSKIEEAVGVTKKVLGLHADEQAMDVEVGTIGHTFNPKAVVCIIVDEHKIYLVLTKSVWHTYYALIHNQLKLLGWCEDEHRCVKSVFTDYEDSMDSWFKNV